MISEDDRGFAKFLKENPYLLYIDDKKKSRVILSNSANRIKRELASLTDKTFGGLHTKRRFYFDLDNAKKAINKIIESKTKTKTTK